MVYLFTAVCQSQFTYHGHRQEVFVSCPVGLMFEIDSALCACNSAIGRALSGIVRSSVHVFQPVVIQTHCVQQ